MKVHDPDRRKQTCEIFEEMFRADPSRIDKIIRSDEAIFKLKGLWIVLPEFIGIMEY